MPSPQNRAIRFVKVQILQQSGGADELGQPKQTYTTYATCKAQVINVRGTEAPSGQQINALGFARIVFRYQDVKTAFEDGTLAKMYVWYRSTFYDIQGLVSLDQRDQWVECSCVARLGYAPVFA